MRTKPQEAFDYSKFSWEALNERLAREEKDPDWSQYVVNYLGSALASSDAGLDLVEGVDCRRTICSVVLDFKRQDALQRAGKLLQADDHDFRYKVAQTDAGVTTVTLLVTRAAPEEE